MNMLSKQIGFSVFISSDLELPCGRQGLGIRSVVMISITTTVQEMTLLCISEADVSVQNWRTTMQMNFYEVERPGEILLALIKTKKIGFIN